MRATDTTVRDRPRPGLIGRLVLVLAALSMVAGACSSDGDSETSTESDAPADDPEPTEEATAEEESEPTETATPDEADTAEETPTEMAEENFASFTGVTEDTIKVGVTAPDFEALVAAGINSNQGDASIVFQAYFDQVNAAGGIHGRMIEPVFTTFNFISPVTQEEACTKMTQDEEVFIVLYGVLAQNNLCFTELNETMVMTDQFQTSEIRDQSGDTMWLQLRSTDDERTRIMGAAMAESGRLDGKIIGILANGNLSGGVDGEIMQETLGELGFDSTLVTTTAPIDDITAQDSEREIWVERFQTEGVDFLFDLAGTENQDLIDLGFTPEIAKAILQVETAEPDLALDGALTVGPLEADDYWFDTEFREACIDPVLASNPDLEEEFSKLPSTDEQATGEVNWSNTTTIACNQVRLLKDIGELAGADLTNESFLAAVDELGPIDFYGYGQASFRSTDKWDGLDEFYIQQYDAATNSIQVIGDPIVVER